MFGMPLAVVALGTLALAAGAAAIAYRHRIEAVAVPIFERPTPSGPAVPRRLTREIPLASLSGASLSVDVWYPPDAAGRRPLVVYIPGWGNPRTDNTLLVAELASHGFVVLALDDISRAPPPGSLRDPRDTAQFDISSDAALPRALDIANWRLKRMTARVSELLDHLAAEQKSNSAWPLADRIDFASIAVAGFSFGGSAAVELTRHDQRIAAAVNMDGWAFGDSAAAGWDKPVLVFNSDYPNLLSDSRSTSPERRLTARLTIVDRSLQSNVAAHGPTIALICRGTEHDDFTDELFSPPLGTLLKFWPRSSASRLSLRRETNRLILDFLETYLTHTRSNPPALNDDSKRAGIEPLQAPAAFTP